MGEAIGSAVRRAVSFAMDSGSNIAAMTRYIPTLSGSQYGTLSEAITFTGDFEVEVEFATTNAADTKVMDGSAGVLFRIETTVGGTISAHVGNGSAWIVDLVGSISVDDGKVHTLKVTKVGSDYAMYIDGVEDSTQNTATAVTPSITYIGTLFSIAAWFEGQILSTKFTDKSGAEDVVTNYVFDSGSTLYQMPRGEALGATLVEDGGFDAGISGWSDQSQGTGSISWTGSAIQVAGPDFANRGEARYELADLTIGAAYNFKSDIPTGGSAGTFIVFSDTETGSLNTTVRAAVASTSSTEEFVFTPTSATHWLILRVQDGTEDFDNVFVQKASKACTLTNFSSSDWTQFLYTQHIVHDGGSIVSAWVGPELVVNGGFDTDTDWTKQPGWTIGGGTLTASAAAQFSDAKTVADHTIAASVYITKFVVSDYSAGEITSRTGQSLNDAVSANGSYTQVIESPAANQDIKFAVTSVAAASMDVDNVSVKQLLEIS